MGKFLKCSFLFLLGFQLESFAMTRQMEALNRGLVAANVNSGMLVSFRLLGTEEPNTSFYLYRDGQKIKTISGTEATTYLDKQGSVNSVYTVAPVVNGVEGKKSEQAMIFSENSKYNNVYFPYKTLSLDVPKNLTMPDGSTCSYTPNDMSVGDLDGDGEYELVLKWDPSNSQDNSKSGYTGNVYIDAYKLNGKKLWRIDLGKNIRAGAHYTQFMVYDLDGDGISEIAMKTADGTIDGVGNVIGNASVDNRNSSGTILTGNEYLTVFNGSTGAAITTIDYNPKRSILAQSKSSGAWGDNYGNRSERYLAAIAYLDGVHPSLIMCRGYYTAAYVTAYDFDGKTLKERFFHKSEKDGDGLYGEGNHNISVGDINGDGLDEIVFGSAALKADGTVLYRTGFGHGDAMHLSDLNPDNPGLELWDVHEESTSPYGFELRDKNGKVLFGERTNSDNGRGLAADIDSARGFEMWSTANYNVYNASGKIIGTSRPSVNFRVYFDGDVYDELLDATGSGGSGGKIEKWNIATKQVDRLFNLYQVNSSTLNNSTKATPCISADLFGDWREEIIMRSSTDPSKITIFTTPFETTHRVYTLMHDAHYRLSIAWQNVAYNQPPHLGYYLPDMVKNLKKPDIYTVSFSGEIVYPAPSIIKNGAGSSRQTITLGDSIVNYAYAYANCDGVSVSGLPEGISADLNTADQKIYISGTPLKAGVFNYTVKTFGGQGDAAMLSGVITVIDPNNPNPPTIESSVLNAAYPVTGNGVYENYNTGFVEDGYFNFNNELNASAVWNIYSPVDTTVTLSVSYANGGTEARGSTLLVNNESSVLEFNSTGAWTTYNKEEVEVTLKKGLNVLEIISNTESGSANVDAFEFSAGGIRFWTSADEETLKTIAMPESAPKFSLKTWELWASESGYANIRIFNANGKLVKRFNQSVLSGANKLSVNPDSFAKGIYIIQIRLNENLIAKKVFNNLK